MFNETQRAAISAASSVLAHHCWSVSYSCTSGAQKNWTAMLAVLELHSQFRTQEYTATLFPLAQHILTSSICRDGPFAPGMELLSHAVVADDSVPPVAVKVVTQPDPLDPNTLCLTRFHLDNGVYKGLNIVCKIIPHLFARTGDGRLWKTRVSVDNTHSLLDWVSIPSNDPNHFELSASAFKLCLNALIKSHGSMPATKEHEHPRLTIETLDGQKWVAACSPDAAASTAINTWKKVVPDSWPNTYENLRESWGRVVFTNNNVVVIFNKNEAYATTLPPDVTRQSLLNWRRITGNDPNELGLTLTNCLGTTRFTKWLAGGTAPRHWAKIETTDGRVWTGHEDEAGVLKWSLFSENNDPNEQFPTLSHLYGKNKPEIAFQNAKVTAFYMPDGSLWVAETSTLLQDSKVNWEKIDGNDPNKFQLLANDRNMDKFFKLITGVGVFVLIQARNGSIWRPAGRPNGHTLLWTLVSNPNEICSKRTTIQDFLAKFPTVKLVNKTNKAVAIRMPGEAMWIARLNKEECLDSDFFSSTTHNLELDPNKLNLTADTIYAQKVSTNLFSIVKDCGSGNDRFEITTIDGVEWRSKPFKADNWRTAQLRWEQAPKSNDPNELNLSIQDVKDSAYIQFIQGSNIYDFVLHMPDGIAWLSCGLKDDNSVVLNWNKCKAKTIYERV